MSYAFLYCIAGAAILIYLPFLLVAYERLQIGYEALATPRAKFDQLSPYAQRAMWAHQNSFEAFTLFAPAALMAYVTHVSSSVAVLASISFVVARLFYSVFYILNVPILRSLMFGVGSFASATLITLSIIHATS